MNCNCSICLERGEDAIKDTARDVFAARVFCCAGILYLLVIFYAAIRWICKVVG